MFSMGVAKPERSTEGIMKTKVPSMACCCVLRERGDEKADAADGADEDEKAEDKRGAASR